MSFDSPTEYSQKKRHGGKRGASEARKYPETCSAETAALVDPNKPLTDLQKAFVRKWAEGESITSACVKVGYSDHKFAYRLARMPNVLKLRAEYAAEYEKAAQMDRKQVMEGFKKAIEMAEMQADPANMIAGWREIGKMCGYYAPVEHRVKMDVSGNVTMKTIVGMSDEELLEAIEKKRQSLALPLVEDITDVDQP